MTEWLNQRRQWHPTPVLLPGKSHGWRNLQVGYSPWGCKESDMTEQLHIHVHVQDLWRKIKQWKWAKRKFTKCVMGAIHWTNNVDNHKNPCLTSGNLCCRRWGQWGQKGKGRGVGRATHIHCWLQHHLVGMPGELCTGTWDNKGSRDQFCQVKRRRRLVITIKGRRTFWQKEPPSCARQFWPIALFIISVS